MQADPVMQAPFWSQGLNRYSYVFNDPLNNTDPSGFISNGGESTIGIMGWGGAVVAGAAFGGWGFLGGSALAGGNIGFSLSPFGSGYGGGHPGSVTTVTPSSAPTSAVGGRGPMGGSVGQVQGGVGPHERFFGRPNGTGGAGSEDYGLGQEGRANAGPGPRTPDPGRFLAPAGGGLYKLSPEGLNRLGVLRDFHYDFRRLRFQFSEMGDTPGEASGDMISLNSRWDTFLPDDQLHTIGHEGTHSVQAARLGRARAGLRHAWEELDASIRGESPYGQPTTLHNMSVHQLNPVDSRFRLEAIADKAGDAVIGFGE